MLLNAQEVSRKDISQATKHYKIATKKYEKGEYALAIAEYKEAVKLNPNYADAFNDMGYSYSKLGDYENSISSYNMALSIKPDHTLSKNNKKIAQFNKAHTLSDAGDQQGSLPYYLAAINTDPNYVEAYNDLAIAYLKLENYDLAIANLDMALTVKPDYELARNNKADVYCKQGTKKINSGDTQGAISSYLEAISTSPNYIESYNGIAIAYLKQEDYNMAIIQLDKALAISPYSEMTKENRALAYLKRGTKKAKTGDNQGAVSDFMESIVSNPYSEEVYIKTATAYTKLNNQKQSQLYNEKALKIKDEIVKRNEAKEYYSEGTKKYAAQNYKEAIIDYTKAISIYPDYFEAYNDRGSAYNLIRKSNKAIADFKKALHINPNYSIAQKNKELVEQYKKERFFSVLNLVTSGLSLASSTIDLVSDIKNPSTKDYSSPTTIPTVNSNTQSKTPDCGTYWHFDSQTYSSWTNMLIDMSVKDYDDGRRRKAQSQMKEIREKWAAKGCLIPKSKWEDWDGTKNNI
jgi:tetratricopeptide (TPR) repeat protein